MPSRSSIDADRVANVGLILSMELGAVVEARIPAAMYGRFFAFKIGKFKVLAVRMDAPPEGHLCVVATGVAFSR